MFGLNGGYDSRSLKSGNTDTGVIVTNKKTVGFQQIALNAEAVSNSWTLNGYGLLPVGDVEQKLNSVYDAGALNTYGLDAGYFITPVLKASAGYYYQHRDQEDVDGSGVRGRLAYEISNGLTAGVNVSYDEAFDTRVSTDLKVRFGGASTTAKRKAVQQLPVINALTSTPSNRDVRVHDWCLNIKGQQLPASECEDPYVPANGEDCDAGGCKGDTRSSAACRAYTDDLDENGKLVYKWRRSSCGITQPF
jgi:hypothetical protein